MKKATITIKTLVIILGLFIFNGCYSSLGSSPSKNSALKNITSTDKEEKSYSMQKTLDRWLKEEWTPSVEKNATIRKINQDKERDFKLQEYVDKVKVYLEENNTSSKDVHWQKVNSLPVIGK